MGFGEYAITTPRRRISSVFIGSEYCGNGLFNVRLAALFAFVSLDCATFFLS